MRRTRAGVVVVALVMGLLGLSAVSDTDRGMATGAHAQTVTWDFEDTSASWEGRGSATVSRTTDESYEGGASLLTTGRTQNWHGAQIAVTDLLAPDVPYTISAWVKLPTGTSGTAAIKFTVQEQPEAFAQVNNPVTVGADTWVHIEGGYTRDSGVTSALLYLEAAEETVDFLVDNVTIEGPEVGPGPPDDAELPSIHTHYSGYFPIGAAIDERETVGASGALTAEHFNQVTAENHMKPYAWYTGAREFRIHPQATTMMDFAQANDIRMFGHVLVWHDQSPGWFFDDDAGNPLAADAEGQAILQDRMRDHIFGIAELLSDTYGLFGSDTNPLVAWDVVNEVIDDGGQFSDGMRRSEWYRILGEEFVDLAFLYADEAFNDAYAHPDADRPVTLFINEYSTEWPDKRNRYHALVERLVGRGVPIDGVGHQFHVSANNPSVASLEAAIQQFQGMELIQAVTEMDVGISSTSAANLAVQAAYYGNAFAMFRDYVDDLYSVTVWGVHDGRTWRDEVSPLLFNADLTPKPAAFAVVDFEPATDPDPDPDPELTLAITADARCVARNVFITVSARNDNDQPVDIDIVGPTGTRSFSDVAAGRHASHAFNTRSTSVDATSVTVHASGVVDGTELTVAYTVEVEAASCAAPAT